MLETFLKVAAAKEMRDKERARTADLMSRLDKDTLFKIANGDIKVAGLCGDDGEWLEKYKGTPLLSKAVELLQQEIALDRQELEDRERRRLERENEPDTYAEKDNLRLEKKLLDLELASLEVEDEGYEMEEPTVEEPMVEEPPIEESPIEEEKTSSTKRAFAVTEKGHRYDAERARLKAQHAANLISLGERYGAIRLGIPILRFGTSDLTAGDPRQEEYVARQHEAGSNAWNPLGGMLTPSSFEEGGRALRYGRHKQPEEKTSSLIKAAQRMRKAASSEWMYGAEEKTSSAESILSNVGYDLMVRGALPVLEKDAGLYDALLRLGYGASKVGRGASAGFGAVRGVGGAAPNFLSQLGGGLREGTQAFGRLAVKKPGLAAGMAGTALGATALGAGGLGYLAGRPGGTPPVTIYNQ